jgi:hypothetical protein
LVCFTIPYKIPYDGIYFLFKFYWNTPHFYFIAYYR